MKQQLIGTTEHIILPEIGKVVFPAKIDTGADSSAIWASDIEQKDGTLFYTLFAPGSMYYTGQRLQTDTFKITSVKSSFGHEEIRYKVRLKITIGKITISRWFSLANRSQNTFPILLGKNFLKNRFIVDVSQNYIHSQHGDVEKVLVITAEPEKMDHFLEEVKKSNEQPLEYKTVTFEKLLFDIHGRLTSVINTGDDNMDVAYYNLTYIKSHWHYPELAAALAEYLIFKNKPFFDQELKNYTSRSKLGEGMQLATHDILVPRTIAGYPVLLKDEIVYIEEALGYPIVIKAASADRGKDNYIVSDREQLVTILEKAEATEIYLAQQFIENDGFYRINVFGKEPRLAVFRSTYPHKDPLKKHLNKPSGGVNATEIPMTDIDPEVAELAVRGAMCMERGIAGVDLVQDKNTKEWYILEVNSSPQLRTGAYIEKKAIEFARFIDKELRR
jgi:glutathione synthase/RimK-type ligase-like ATP-grasp enzyme